MQLLLSQGGMAIERWSGSAGSENTQKFHKTYQADTLTKSGTGGKPMKDMDGTLEGFHKFAIVSSKLAECSCLLFKHGSDRLDRVAIFELSGERVVDQFHPRLSFIAL